ncbi:MAG: HAMP domain-containing protein, partial [Planctomycetes bacterium]|nr:HAMP domain-containing protein [Planctomycetota bacterium]
RDRHTMRFPLICKLLALQATVVALVLGAVWLSIEWHASDYFMTLMEKFDVDAPEVNSMFLSANRRSLLWVGGAALLVVAVFCWWMTRRILAPLGEIRSATERIAAGDYECRIETRTRDELDDLTKSFHRMAESLAQMEQLRRSMVVDVAHELRTPLNNLRGYIEGLQDGIVEPSARTLDILHGELLRLVRLTEDLLAAARAGAQDDPKRSRQDVVAILRETMRLFRPRLERRGLEVRDTVRDESAGVLANPDQLKQVFTNLFQNCLQFAPEGTWIALTETSDDRSIRVEFSNPGIGIDANDLPWIFEPYYRADRSRSRDTGGAGIGLAIVRSLVEAHGGRVGANSDATTTKIWVELPNAG